jgi:hypothetical protein
MVWETLGRPDAAVVIPQDRHAAAISFLEQTLEDLLSAIRVGVQQQRDARLERIKDTAARPAAPRLEAYRATHVATVFGSRPAPGRSAGSSGLGDHGNRDFAERLVINHDRAPQSGPRLLPRM